MADTEVADYRSRLLKAVKFCDRAGVEEVCDDLVGRLYGTDESLSDHEAARIIQTLRRARLFELAEKVTDALIVSGSDTHRVRRLHAQTLLDHGRLSAVLIYLKELETLSQGIAGEAREARGLMGRAFKQMYLLLDPRTKRAEECLNRAIDYYRGVAEAESEAGWFGVNVVALLSRAARDGVAVSAADGRGQYAAEVARRVLEQIQLRAYDAPSPAWDCATAAEACLALGRSEEALSWLIRAVSAPEADAFELESISRQFTEVWGLKIDSEPGASLLAVLWGALLLRRGIALAVWPGQLKPGPLLRQLAGGEGRDNSEASRIAGYLLAAKARADAVVTVRGRGGGPHGTGLLLRGEDLHERFGPRPVLLTSCRVLSEHPAVVEALRPDEAVLTAEGLEQVALRGRELKVGKILWAPPPHELGVTLAEVSGDIEGLVTLRGAESAVTQSPADTLYLIGQLGTSDPPLSIQQNLLIHGDHSRLHYRSLHHEPLPGAPVLNAEWGLLGLHVSKSLPCDLCSGSSSEGVTLRAVRDALRKDFSDVGEVFVSYSRRDQEFVLKLAEALRAARVRVWLDQWCIPDASNWDDEIDKALARCSRMLIVLSPQSINSAQVRGELQTALNDKKPVVPVMYQPCERLPRQLSLTQYIDFTNWDEREERPVARILDALRLGGVAESKP